MRQFFHREAKQISAVPKEVVTTQTLSLISMAVPHPWAIHLLQVLMVESPKWEVQQEYEQHLDFNPVMIYDCEEQNRISSPPQLLILQK